MAVVIAALLTATLPLAAYRALAQNAPGVLAGSIYDPTGGVLPQVQLTLAYNGQIVATTRTDGSGRYRFTGVAPGQYRLRASLAGFNALERDLDLEQSSWEQPITLQVGTVQETISVTTPRGPTPAAARAGNGALRVGGNIRAPRKTRDVRPIYPPAMREAGIEGSVPLEALIGKDGTVTFVRVISSLVHPDLALAAERAVRQWQFEPTLLNGEPIDVVMTVTVRFSLTD